MTARLGVTLRARYLRTAIIRGSLRCATANRVAFARPLSSPSVRAFTAWPARLKDTKEGNGGEDARLRHLGREIADEFAKVKDHYETPKHPVVLAHGLLGFAELRLAGDYLPAVHYWHGISAALRAKGVEVIATSVPPSGSIQERASKLAEDIAAKTSNKGSSKSVNIIAHSMGGLDARYMISHLAQEAGLDVKALVTIATPHHGSSFADYVLSGAGVLNLKNLYGMIERVGLGTAAFAQLTTTYMDEEFNPETPDRDGVRYFSYGAMMGPPPLFSPFRQSYKVLQKLEGPNDGLVSVESSRWGTYKGTLVGVSHLDLINWSNRLRWTVRRWLGQDKTFNAIAFYLDIADMLAKEGL